MKKRPWLLWTLGIIVVALIAGGIYAKKVIAEQPQEVEDPGIPEVIDLPDPDDME